MNRLEALQQIMETVPLTKNETVSLEESIGRVLAEPLVADRAYPPFNRAAMDGIALNSTTFQKGKPYLIGAEIFAGQLKEVALADHECVRIMTGAPVPLSCDVVIRVEDTAVNNDGSISSTLDSVKPWMNIARKGEDVLQGAIALNTGIVMGSGEVAIAASLGYARVKVMVLPRVDIVTTGDEIVGVEQTPQVQQIRNSNAWTLTALLKKNGIVPSRRIHAVDEPSELEKEFSNSLSSCDVLLVSGGVSAGNADYVPAALQKAGVVKIFHKVQIKPGKPIWFGKAENGTVVFALPGNPLSVQVCFKLFVEPWILKYSGQRARTAIKMRCADARAKKNDLDEFLMATLDREEPGLVRLKPFNGSGDITATAGVDGLVLHASGGGDLKAGDVVEYVPL